MSRVIEDFTRCAELEYLWKLLHEWRLDKTEGNEGVDMYSLSVLLSQTPFARTYFIDALNEMVNTVEVDNPSNMETFDMDTVIFCANKIKEKCYE